MGKYLKIEHADFTEVAVRTVVVSDKAIITVEANPLNGGVVTGSGQYNIGESVEISAVPNPGYLFVGWDDGELNATRTIIATSSQYYTALFEIDDTFREVNMEQGGTDMNGAKMNNANAIRNINLIHVGTGNTVTIRCTNNMYITTARYHTDKWANRTHWDSTFSQNEKTIVADDEYLCILVCANNSGSAPIIPSDTVVTIKITPL